MCKFPFKFLFIIFLFFSHFVPQAQVEIETSGLVTTRKKTDFAQIVLEKDNGHIFVLVQDYKRRISFIHEFDEKMKFKKSTTIKEIRGRVISARFDGNDLNVFALESAKGKGKTYKVNFSKGRLELIDKEVFEIDFNMSLGRKSKTSSKNANNIVDESYYLGSNVDFSGYAFYSDNKNYLMVAYSQTESNSHNTMWDKPDKSSLHAIVMLDDKFKVVKTHEIEFKHKGYYRFITKDIQYNEEHKAFIFHGRLFPLKKNNTPKKERRINDLGYEVMYIVKENEKPIQVLLQGNEEVVTASNIKLQNNVITVSNVVYPRNLNKEDITDISVRVSEFDFIDLSKINSVETIIPEHNFTGKEDEGFMFNAFRTPIMEKKDGHYIIGLYNYDTSSPQIFQKIDVTARRSVISHWRIKGEYHILNVDVKDGSLNNHYVLERDVYVKKKMEQYYKLQISGQWEYWNHGVNSIYKDGKILFFLNAESIATENNRLVYSTKKIKQDAELIKAKPYVVTLDMDTGFTTSLLGGKTANVNGLMVEKMYELKDGVYITNTPKTKQKKYVKVTVE